jgi:putative MATE family efflux protein
VGGALFLGAGALSRFITDDEATIRFASIYLRVLAPAVPAMAIVLVGNASLRGAGDTSTPFLVMVLVNAVNVAVSLLLVWGPEPIGGRGVSGIAIGTSAAWACGAIAVLGVLLGGPRELKLRPGAFRPQRAMLGRLLRVGVPNLLEVVGGTWLATFIVLKMVGTLESEASLGAHMIAIRIEALSFQPGFAFGVAAATLVGQYLGLGDPARAKRAAATCWASAVLLMGSAGLVFMAAPEALVRVLTANAELVATASPLVRICGAVQIFFASYLVLSQALRGAGDTRTTMWLTYLSVYGLRVPLAYGLGLAMGLGLNGIWIALCADLTLRGLLFSGRFLGGGWTRIKV